ncbi:MAG: metallophosphoesterase [Desulfuromonadales bacterium]
MTFRLIGIMKTFLAVILVTLIAGCSSGGSSNQGSGVITAEAGTGTIAVKLDWGSTSKVTAKTVTSAPAGVATVRIIVSGSGITPALQKDFTAASGTGTIEGIPAGTGRTLTAQGLDVSGMVTYQGTTVNITVQAGQTTDVGMVAMTAVTSVPFNGTVVLGSPTVTSIKANVFSSDQSGTVLLRYGTSQGVYDLQTAPAALFAGKPLLLSMEGLAGDTRYYYRLFFQVSDGSGFSSTDEYTFHTARPVGSSFTFTIQADSHLDENSNLDQYRRTLGNVLTDTPDFHIDLGDTFMCEKHSEPLTSTVQMAPDQTTVNARYRYERANFGIVARAAPLFLVNGNHEGEAGWLADGTANNIAIWTTLARQLYYVNPVPDGFYSGDSTIEPFVGKRASWYAWQWGDALFVVLDPFWNSMTMSSKDPWALTLGETQYQWFRQTLSSSRAKFKFVFIHNLVGGLDGQMRGGVEAAPFFEWGGRNLDGTAVFNQKRPGWSMPIHQMLVNYGVTAIFHGHDHLYARQVLDGVVYQEVPQPGAKNFSSGPSLATEYHYATGTILSSSGHLRVTVCPDGVTARYVRSWLPVNETVVRKNGQVDDIWSIGAP